MIRLSQIETARASCAAPATPAGGARVFGGRGCGYLLAALGLTLCAGLSHAAEPHAIAVPSGQAVTLSEVLLDDAPGELWARFRFIAPAIADATGTVSAQQAAPDMDHLCQTLALPYLQTRQLNPAKVVISLSDRQLPFGQADATATQFFELYRPEGDSCVWEAF